LTKIIRSEKVRVFLAEPTPVSGSGLAAVVQHLFVGVAAHWCIPNDRCTCIPALAKMYVVEVYRLVDSKP
jgi:hypothetical protein